MPSEIPFIRPTFPGLAELTEDFGEIVESNWFTNFGPKERQFARALGEYLGPELHVATLANGTLALVAALHAENVIARKYFWPGCHRMEPYRTLNPQAGLQLRETERVASQVIVLPTGQQMKKGDIQNICRVIRELLG
jgi:dTDP-4-amino-4,6-dideoxygalactose transaminase